MRHFIAVDKNLAALRTQDSEHALYHHRFAGTRTANDYQRLAARNREIEPVEHGLRTETLLHTTQLDFGDAVGHPHHREKRMEVRK